MCLSNVNYFPSVAILTPKTVYKVFIKTDDENVVESAIRNTPYRMGQKFESKLVREKNWFDEPVVNYGIHSFEYLHEAQEYVYNELMRQVCEAFSNYVPLSLRPNFHWYDEDKLPSRKEFENRFVLVRCEIPRFHRFYRGDWGSLAEYTSIASTALIPVEKIDINNLDTIMKKYDEKYARVLRKQEIQQKLIVNDQKFPEITDHSSEDEVAEALPLLEERIELYKELGEIESEVFKDDK